MAMRWTQEQFSIICSEWGKRFGALSDAWYKAKGNDEALAALEKFIKAHDDDLASKFFKELTELREIVTMIHNLPCRYDNGNPYTGIDHGSIEHKKIEDMVERLQEKDSIET
ncbi:MAG: hypothetical protein WDA06_00950 [Phenylobacterium sp.]